MSGAAGHLLHLSEDLSLTFRELKEIFSLATNGKLERVTEKTDGVNLVFTWNEELNELRAARSSSDLHKGGMDALALASKFRDRGNVTDAFVTGFEVLKNAIGVLSNEQRKAVFGDAGDRWFSVEIIYSLLPNVVNYDRDYVVFHGQPIFEIKNGKAVKVDGEFAIKILEANIAKMQAAIKQRSWRIMGTAVVQMQRLSSGKTLDDAFLTLDDAMNQAHVTDDDSLGTYLAARCAQDAAAAGLSQDLANDVGKRVAGLPGQNVVQLRKRAGKQADIVNDLVLHADETVKRYIEPIERAIFELSLEVLRGVRSVLIQNPDEELRRLQKYVQQAITVIQASGDVNSIDVLRTQMLKLRSIDRISSPIEGIVFVYKGRAYKFTGSFTPVHKILSLFKFGKAGSKLEMPKNEAVKRRYQLVEGGGAFEKAKPISLDDYNSLIPEIKRDIQALGASRIEPVGSTGKKNLMGDLDFAVEFEGGAAELADLASAAFGRENVKKIGGNVVSILYPVQLTNSYVQIDLMVGNVGYVSWARSGSSTMHGHVDYSAARGVIKNLLLNAVAKFASEKLLHQPSDRLERYRYVFDFDKGLFMQHQTKHGLRGELANWKTLDSKQVSNDPNKIIELLLGIPNAAASARTLENVVRLIKRSPIIGVHANELFNSFIASLHDIAVRDPRILGSNPLETISTIEEIVGISNT